jgi:hypothetical protein
LYFLQNVKPSPYAVKSASNFNVVAASGGANTAEKRANPIAKTKSDYGKKYLFVDAIVLSSKIFFFFFSLGTYGGPVAPTPPPAAQQPPVRRVRVLYDFTPGAGDEDGLAVCEGDVLIVRKPSEDGDWLLCALPNNRGEGYVPLNYTEPA